MDERRFHADDPLERAWDEVVRGRPPRSEPALDPALAEVVRLVHALDDAPAPDRAFARNLRKELEAMSATPLFTDTVLGGLRSNGTAAATGLPRRPHVGHLLSAALVAATLGAGYATTAILRSGDGGPAIAPAALLAATPDAAEPAIETLVRTTTDRMPTAFTWAGLAQVTIQPGGAEAPFASPDPRLVVVEAGTVGIRADAPVMVGRAEGALVPETSPTLVAGDLAVVPAGLEHAFYNASTPGDPTPAEPAVLVDGAVTAATLSGASGTDVEMVLLASVSGGPVPAAPAEVAVGRVTLKPGEALLAPPAGELRVVGPLPADDGIVRTSGDGSAHNTGDRAVTVYVLTARTLPVDEASPGP